MLFDLHAKTRNRPEKEDYGGSVQKNLFKNGQKRPLSGKDKCPFQYFHTLDANFPYSCINELQSLS